MRRDIMGKSCLLYLQWIDSSEKPSKWVFGYLFPVDVVHGHDMSFRMCQFLPIFMLVPLFGGILLENPFLGPGT